MTDTPSYPNSDLLVEPSWLGDRFTRPDIRVVDMGTYDAYARAHIPGAVHPGPGDRLHYLKDEALLAVLPPDRFAAMMSRMGIGPRTLVIAYDADGGHTAARLWWALAHYGHTQAKLLNGGWNQWIAEKRPVAMDIPHGAATPFKPTVARGLLCTLEQVRKGTGDPGTVFLDVRSDEEWDGTNHRNNRRAGRLPSAVHIEWRQFVTDDSLQRFRPASELRRILQAAGVTPNKRVITY